MGPAGTLRTASAERRRLLRSILATALADGLTVSNPYVIKGAGQERAPERRVPSVEMVRAIADAAGGRYRALVLTAAFSGLRSGELAALERRHVDLVHRTVSVQRQAQTVVGRGRVLGPPKSAAGARTIAIPGELVGVLDGHLATWVGLDPASLVLTSGKGGPTRELMARLGHSTPRAALIYQYATEERDHQIAAGIDDILEAARRVPKGSVVRIDRNASRT